MPRSLEPIPGDALDAVVGGVGGICADTPEERQRKLSYFANAGSMRYRQCRINEFCQRRQQGQSFNDADRASKEICTQREREAGEAP